MLVGLTPKHSLGMPPRCVAQDDDLMVQDYVREEEIEDHPHLGPLPEGEEI